jgi:sugar transferase (PEP-CTERM/EpsH1 system associated)
VSITCSAPPLDAGLQILFLSQRVPFPPNRGDKITTWRIVERLHRKHTLTCLAFEHGAADAQAVEELRARGFRVITVPYRPVWAMIKAAPRLLGSSPLTTSLLGSSRLRRELERLIPNTDVAYAFSSSMGAYLLPHRGVARVMHFAELDSDKWRQYADRTDGPMRWVYAREARTLFALERAIAYSFSENVLCTRFEQEFFQAHMPGAPSTVLRNGVDVDYFRPAPAPAEGHGLVFTGVMNYFPNVDACVHFAHDVFPRVRERFADASFTIVGATPTREVRRLASIPGVRVTGFVPDTREYLKRAAVVVAPLRIARGIQNKVLEGMAAGLPVVGTTSSTRGVDGVAGRDYLVADTDEEQVAALSRLLASPEERRQLGARARDFVVEHYSWEACLRDLDVIVERQSSARRPRNPPC